MKFLKKIYGYLIIPLWLFLFIATTAFLIYQVIISWFSRKIMKKSNKPYFMQRSIFPPSGKEGKSNG